MSEGTETLIISFIVVCISIIFFDIIQVFRMRYRDRKVEKLALNNSNIDIFLSHPEKLKNEINILAFEKCMDKELVSDIDRFLSHTDIATSVFSDIICDTTFEDQIVKSYIVYLSAKFKLFYGIHDDDVENELLYMITDRDIYVRENALSCVYSIGNSQFVYTALKTLDNSDVHHNEKLLHDGLMKYSGDKNELCNLLIAEYDDFSLNMQIMLSNYFRFTTNNFVENAFSILKDKTKDRELRLSALRYLQKYRYDPAYPTIIEFAKNDSEFWEYRAIAASCLANYPFNETIDILKKMTGDPEWYVRKNAAESLAKLNCNEDILKDVINGPDRFAKEQAQYVLDKKGLLVPEVKPK